MKHLLALSVLAVATAAGAQSSSLRTYTDPALQLTWSYPAELQPLATDPGAGCSRVLLKAALGTDPNLSPSSSDSESPEGSQHWAILTLSDMGPGCIPPQALKKQKILYRMLSGLAGDPTQVLGLSPMEQPMGYRLQGQPAFLAAAQGEPVSQDALQPANGAEVVAVIAARVKDHVVIWNMASNDLGLLNRILAGQVSFGSGSPQPLYPGHIGQ